MKDTDECKCGDDWSAHSDVAKRHCAEKYGFDWAPEPKNQPLESRVYRVNRKHFTLSYIGENRWIAQDMQTRYVGSYTCAAGFWLDVLCGLLNDCGTDMKTANVPRDDRSMVLVKSTPLTWTTPRDCLGPTHAEQEPRDNRYVPWDEETRDCLSLATRGRTRNNEP